MEIKLNKYKSEVIGLYNLNIKSVLKILSIKSSYSIIDLDNIYFKYQYVNREIQYYYKKFNINNKKRLEKFLILLDLDINILNRRISSLSSSERAKLFIITRIINDKDIYIFNNLFKCFDRRIIKCILNLLNELKINNKIVFINDNNINNIYTYLDKMLILDKETIIYGSTNELLTNIDILDKYKIPLPNLVTITYYAKLKYNVKLFYHKDVRDIMKDIYKHV